MSCEAEARKRVIYRVTFVGFVVNLVLTAMKFAAGIAGRSGAVSYTHLTLPTILRV